MARMQIRPLMTMLAMVAALTAGQSAAAAGSNRAEIRPDTIPESLPQPRHDLNQSDAESARPDLTLRGIPLGRYAGPSPMAAVVLVGSTNARIGVREKGLEQAYGKSASGMSHRQWRVLRAALIGAAVGAAIGIGSIEALCRSEGGRHCRNGRAHTRMGGVLGLAGFGIGAAIGFPR